MTQQQSPQQRPGQQAGQAGGLPAQTWAELAEIAARYPQPRSGLLPMLHLVQSVQGRVTSDGIEACAQVLGITAAEVSGVATFYTMYKRRPVGDYLVGVCTNTLCAVMGGDEIFERLKDHLDVGNDETTEDGRITLEHVECNAACDYAPVMMVNWEFVDNQTPESAVRLVDDLRSGAEVRSTRGPAICTFKQAERVLAGFDDGLADEGPSAGFPSLVGLELAQRRGWAPPAGREIPAGGDAGVAEALGDQPREAAQAQAEAGQEGAAAVEDSPAGTKHEDAPGSGDEAQ